MGEPALFHSWPAPDGASHEPGGIRSLSASQRCGGCYSPLDPPCFSTRGPLLTERPTSQGGSAACPLRNAAGAATPPWTPLADPWKPLISAVEPGNALGPDAGL